MKQVSKAERKRAEELGISVGELRLLELLEDVHERLRWAQILGYATQYALRWKEVVTQEELDTVLQAVARSIDRDGSQQARGEEIARLRRFLLEQDEEIQAGRKVLAREKRKRKRRDAGRGERS
ncbi:MAG: hypothetical protein H6834_07130 [Planctomycetes bacterium]|nr:hypothetical protein [Planctomycetota bacterium]MCB9891556.1 hypothetical protein [Planctomycetota bacterium]